MVFRRKPWAAFDESIIALPLFQGKFNVDRHTGIKVMSVDLSDRGSKNPEHQLVLQPPILSKRYFR